MMDEVQQLTPPSGGSPGPVRQFLEADHVRLDALLRRSVEGPTIDLDAYGSFRSGLLRHIMMEEKILLPEVRRLRGGESLPIAKQLRADHAMLGLLLTTTPTRAIIADVIAILTEHNPLEEGPTGCYAVCEQLIGAELQELLARMHAAPQVRVAKYSDGPRVQEHIERMLKERRRAAVR